MDLLYSHALVLRRNKSGADGISVLRELCVKKGPLVHPRPTFAMLAPHLAKHHVLQVLRCVHQQTVMLSEKVEYKEEIDNVVRDKGSSSIPEYSHLLTDMRRRASAKGRSVYSFLTSIPHYPVVQATSDFHPPTVVPNTHLSTPWLLSEYIHLAVHACLFTVGQE